MVGRFLSISDLQTLATGDTMRPGSLLLPPSFPLVGLLLPLVLSCGPGADDSGTRNEASSRTDLTGIPMVSERWVSPWDTTSNLDSPAVWSGEKESWVVATAKGTHQLWVYDASTGDLLRTVGGPGEELGRFLRPNGIAVVGDLLLVVERDNHRIQVLSLPDFRPRGAFGSQDLVRPYGIAFYRDDRGDLHLYVTDDYGNEVERPEGEPPTGDFTRRVKHFRLRTDNGLEAELVDSFGEARGPGALRVVESLQVDEEQDLLLVADEFGPELEAYHLDGTYAGRSVARDLYRFGDPEGIMLYRCGGDGYWILTDQGEGRTVFHVLDRRSLESLGSFAGEVTANTDGIWLTQEAIPGLGQGGLVALHDDGGLSAFAWNDIAQALGLRSGCPPSGI